MHDGLTLRRAGTQQSTCCVHDQGLAPHGDERLGQDMTEPRPATGSCQDDGDGHGTRLRKIRA
ncbi:hypothetical protein CSO01_24600 [Cellulomonas soli]|uniref:Uncharacterized protein n=1 Tax=Cellulomonas soli TaxID=931535 RepID=A0A512PEV9_9CELL|nr:hypothetical protein CSO01_24600 [Cellulomonas soli]